MRLFDFHCDTLYKALTENKTLNEKTGFHISVDRGKAYDRWIQCMAIWIPDEIRGNKAVELLNNAYSKLKYESKSYDINIIKSKDDFKSDKKASFIFTVEGGAALAGDIKNVSLLKEFGVKFVTLTWNGKNELGDGCLVDDSRGLTDFGRKAVRELEKNNIFIDLSHASDRLFYDTAEIITKPIVATHSNSRSITNHPRNLTDEQFQIIKNSGGIVGLNFYKEFLNGDCSKASMYDIIKHADHFLSLGGENTICLGSDFDGADLPEDISGIERMYDLYELFLKNGYKESVVNKIFYENGYYFCENFDNS